MPAVPFRLAALLIALLVCAPVSAQPIDPPYQAQMERLAQVMGSLYFLQPLCADTAVDWRGQMADLIALEEPTPDREARLAGAFNAGYEAYARFYRTCTESAQEAMRRLLSEGGNTARDMHARFSE